MARFNSHLTAEMEEGCSEEAILTDAERAENTRVLKAIFPSIYFEFTPTEGDTMKALPKKGEEVIITGYEKATAVLRKAGRDWSLRCGRRVRWGNAQEIREDIKHFQEYGKLPPQIVGGWA